MSRSSKNQFKFKSLSPTPFGFGRESTGGWKWLRYPAAIFSSTQRKNRSEVKIKISNSIQANDNSNTLPLFQVKFSYGIIALLFLVLISISNFSALATEVILKADDKVLNHAMDNNPEALAFALNLINVGE